MASVCTSAEKESSKGGSLGRDGIALGSAGRGVQRHVLEAPSGHRKEPGMAQKGELDLGRFYSGSNPASVRSRSA